MKYCVMLLWSIAVSFGCFANTYYSQGSLPANNLSSWNTNRAGGGTAPLSFVTAGDVFVVQAAHSVTTAGAWTIGSAGSILQVESGGILQGNDAVLLTGTFQVDNGGTYIHNNNASVSTAAGASIFGGIESFGTASTIEVRRWINNTTPLPASITWGNLVINYTSSLGGSWNQMGNLVNIQGDLNIKATGTAGQDFRLTDATNMNATISGDLIVSGGLLVMKDNNMFGTTGIVQVNGSILVTGGTINLGIAALYNNGELRFRHNLLVSGTGSIASADNIVTVVANGTGLQTIASTATFGCNLKIASGANAIFNSSMLFSPLKLFIVAGTCDAANNLLDLNGGQIIISGGTLTSGGNINMKDGICQVCTGSGTFSAGTWCANAGAAGVFNYHSGTILFNQSLSSSFFVGSFNSPGQSYLTDAAKISFTGTISGPPSNTGRIELTGGSILSFNEDSYADGKATYSGNGGLLAVGGSAGLPLSGNFGNLRITGTRNYNLGGINSFEFNSSLPQATGDGLPATISGTLRINNSSGQPVVLSANVTIAAGGVLNLARGLLRTTPSFLLTLNRNAVLTGGSILSYIDGPLKKIGETPFVFPVGKNGLFSPVSLGLTGGNTDAFTVEYFPGDPTAAYGNNIIPFVDHISSVEYWLINGPVVTKRLTLGFSSYSQVSSLYGLKVSFFDGSTWLNSGNEGTTGTADSGTVFITTNNWGPYTLASTEPRNIICPGGNTTFTMPSQGTSFTYRWQSDTGSGFTNLSNGANYSGVTSTSLNLLSLPSSFYGNRYRCVAFNGVDSVYGEVRTLKFSSTWLGAADAAWENANNWSCGLVPDANTDVTIPSGAPTQPQINSNAVCRSLTIFAGSSVSVNGAFKLDIKGPPDN